MPFIGAAELHDVNEMSQAEFCKHTNIPYATGVSDRLDGIFCAGEVLGRYLNVFVECMVALFIGEGC